MHRRTYLALVAAGLAGCTGGEETETPTGTPTATQRPGPQPPSIETASLLYSWQEFGDVLTNQVDAVGQGAPALVGYRWDSAIHDGSVNLTEQVRIFDSSGDRVAIDTDTDEQLVDQSGVGTWEHALSFETDRWELGDYEAEVLIRDNEMGATSDAVTTEFTVNGPLSAGETSLVSVDGPATVGTGERYEFELTLENDGTRDGSVVTPVSAKYETGTEWHTYDLTVAVTIAQGDTNGWAGYFEGFNAAGTVVLRLDDIDETWRVDVTG